MFKTTTKNYPVIILKDPWDEENFEGHALFTNELGIGILGDDLITTNIEPLRSGNERVLQK